jgi:hypothetical protein
MRAEGAPVYPKWTIRGQSGPQVSKCVSFETASGPNRIRHRQNLRSLSHNHRNNAVWCFCLGRASTSTRRKLPIQGRFSEVCLKTWRRFKGRRRHFAVSRSTCGTDRRIPGGSSNNRKLATYRRALPGTTRWSPIPLSRAHAGRHLNPETRLDERDDRARYCLAVLVGWSHLNRREHVGDLRQSSNSVNRGEPNLFLATICVPAR